MNSTRSTILYGLRARRRMKSEGSRSEGFTSRTPTLARLPTRTRPSTKGIVRCRKSSRNEETAQEARQGKGGASPSPELRPCSRSDPCGGRQAREAAEAQATPRERRAMDFDCGARSRPDLVFRPSSRLEVGDHFVGAEERHRRKLSVLGQLFCDQGKIPFAEARATNFYAPVRRD